MPFDSLAIPSSVPVVEDPGGVEAIRTRHAPGNRPIVGHFGTYRPAVASLLGPILASVLERSDCVVLLLGRGSAAFRSELVRREPRFEERVHATDGLEVTELSRHILACDVMVQPFPDGINGRQSSASALLAHGRAIVTTTGASTEPMWRDSGATALSAAGESQTAARQVLDLLADEPARTRMGLAARELYQSHFDMRHTIAALRATDLEHRKNS
jgi:glycosyltransferase involved in cell wall biosynthesis